MNDRLTLDNAQQKNNSGSKKSKLAKLKQEALAKIDSVVAVIEKYDEIGTIASMLDGEGGSIEFITTILKELGVTKEEIIAEISEWLCGQTKKIDKSSGNATNGMIDSIELAIKATLYATMQGLFTCSATPLIPNYMFKDTVKFGDGVEIPLNILDVYGMLENCPVSMDGKNFYFDTIETNQMVKTVNDIREYEELKDGQTIKPYEKIKDNEAIVKCFPNIIEKKYRDSIWYTYTDKKGKTKKVFDMSNAENCDYDTVQMHYYQVSGYDQTTVWKSRDFNAYLWYVINKKDAKWDNRNNLYNKTNNEDDKYDDVKEEFFKLDYDTSSGATENQKLTVNLHNIQTVDGKEQDVKFRKKIILDSTYLERVYNTTESDMLKIYLNKEEYFQKRIIKNIPTGFKLNIKENETDPRVKDNNFAYEYITNYDYMPEVMAYWWQGEGTYKLHKKKGSDDPDYSQKAELITKDNILKSHKGLKMDVTEKTTVKLNKTIFEFNYDYIFSLKFFDTQTLVTNIIDSVLNWGLTNATASFSTYDKVVAGVVGKVTDEILRKEETEISDDFYSFSNREYDDLLTQARKGYNGSYKIADENGKLSYAEKDEIIKSLNRIGEASTLQEQKTVIERLLRDVTVSMSQQEEITSQNTLYAGFGSDWACIPRLLHEVVKNVVLQVLSPKVMVLYAINCKIFNDSDTDTSKKVDPIEFMRKNINNLLNSLIPQISNIIVSLLLGFLMKVLQPKIKKFVEKLNLEQAMKYVAQLKLAYRQCVGAYMNWAEYFGGSASTRSVIDNVTYADIIPKQTEPTS